MAQGVRGRPGAEGGVERLAAPTGLSSPGGIHIPKVAQGQDRKDERDRSAIAEAMKWDRDQRAIRTDGSAVSSGGVARQWSTTRRKEKVKSQIGARESLLGEEALHERLGKGEGTERHMEEEQDRYEEEKKVDGGLSPEAWECVRRLSMGR